MVAGALIGVAAFVKPYALLLLPWLAFTYGLSRPWRARLCSSPGCFCRRCVYGWSGNLRLLAEWYRHGQRIDRAEPDERGQRLARGDVGEVARHGRARRRRCVAVDARRARSRRRPSGCAASTWARRTISNSRCSCFSSRSSRRRAGTTSCCSPPPPSSVSWIAGRTSAATGGSPPGVALVLMGLTIFDLMGRALYARFMALSIVSVAAVALAVVSGAVAVEAAGVEAGRRGDRRRGGPEAGRRGGGKRIGLNSMACTCWIRIGGDDRGICGYRRRSAQVRCSRRDGCRSRRLRRCAWRSSRCRRRQATRKTPRSTFLFRRPGRNDPSQPRSMDRSDGSAGWPAVKRSREDDKLVADEVCRLLSSISTGTYVAEVTSGIDGTRQQARLPSARCGVETTAARTS